MNPSERMFKTARLQTETKTRVNAIKMPLVVLCSRNACPPSKLTLFVEGVLVTEVTHAGCYHCNTILVADIDGILIAY